MKKLSNCPPGSKHDIIPGYDLQRLFSLVGVICTIITVLNTVFLLVTHLRYRANLLEQRM